MSPYCIEDRSDAFARSSKKFTPKGLFLFKSICQVRLRGVAYLACVLLAATAASFATTYYVDSVSGNDSFSGTSTSAPWRTLAKVNSKSFTAGDQILLKRGDVWHETLNVSSSGTSTSFIVYSAYGTGSNPLLDEQNVRSYAVTISGKSYVTVSNMQFQNATAYTVYVYNGSYITLSYCIAKNSGSHVFGVEGVSPGVVIDHNSYTMDPTFDMHGSFVDVYSSVESATISNNFASFNGRQVNAGIITLDVDNAQIYGNTIYHSAEGVGVKGYSRNVTGAQIHDNSIYDPRNSYGGDGEGIELTGNYRIPWHASGAVYRNFVEGGVYMTNGIAGVYAPNSQIYDNIVFGPGQDAAFHMSSYCPGTVLYNNVAYNLPVGMAIQSGSTATIVNNIVSTTGNGIAVGGGASAVEDYNIFYNSGANEGVTKGPHSSTADPMFVSNSPATPNDVKLSAGSPAIGSGLKLAVPFNWIMNPTTNNFPYGIIDQNTLSGWERGAFGYKSTNGSPIVNGVTPSSGSGLSQIFTVQYSSPSGYTNLISMNLLLNSSSNTAHGCWVRYHAPDNKLYLQDDTGKLLLGPLTPGSTGNVQNSQCVLHGTGSTAVGSGDTMNVTFSVTFTSTFAGSKTDYAYASDSAGLSSGWQDVGTWSTQ